MASDPVLHPEAGHLTSRRTIASGLVLYYTAKLCLNSGQGQDSNLTWCCIQESCIHRGIMAHLRIPARMLRQRQGPNRGMITIIIIQVSSAEQSPDLLVLPAHSLVDHPQPGGRGRHL
jgi:hypothetical protein